MGNYASIAQSPENLPQLGKDVIQAILMKLPSTVLIENARLVNKTWREVGERNIIWIPRYRELTNVSLRPEDYYEGQVFAMFVKEWNKANHVYLKNGIIYKTSDNLAWIDVSDRYWSGFGGNDLGLDLKRGGAVIGYDGGVLLHDGTFFQIKTDGAVYAIPNALDHDYPTVTLLTTVDGQSPKLFRLVRQKGKRAQVIPVTYARKVIEHHDEKQNIYLSSNCFMCGKVATGLCSKCGDRVYCGKNCQKEDYLTGHCN